MSCNPLIINTCLPNSYILLFCPHIANRVRSSSAISLVHFHVGANFIFYLHLPRIPLNVTKKFLEGRGHDTTMIVNFSQFMITPWTGMNNTFRQSISN